ncbi:MAG: flagellar hook-associated protein FlgK [Acidobacteria bacterium]|mgnify:CR=1 FL=1|nr:flagellar hook-associated protein FlgK [Acidobacteriota bacterium]
MPSLLSGLDMARQALAAQQYALSLTQRNVAHANDPYYTREAAVFTSSISGGVSLGPRVYIEAARDHFLDYGINRELQMLGKAEVTSEALQQIDALFRGSGGMDLQKAISDFFGSFTQLSSTPEDRILRQQVLSKADVLADTFHRLYSGMQRVQMSQNEAVRYTVDEINSLTSQIAVLNREIRAAQGSGSDEEFRLRDTRQQALEQLSGLVDLTYYETDSGSITVMTQQWSLLVLEDRSHDFSTVTSTEGTLELRLNGENVTNAIESGKLAGLIDVRDNKIGAYLQALDDLAATLVSRVNEQHALGSDRDGLAGGDLFVPFVPPDPTSNAGAASSIKVAITDPDRIAAAAAGAAAGNNENAKLIAAIADESLFGASQTANQFLAALVYRIGSDGKAAGDEMLTQKDVLQSLSNLRSSLSGVNLDEEAINIIKYQRAYQASARYVGVLDSLTNEIIQILGA